MAGNRPGQSANRNC